MRTPSATLRRFGQAGWLGIVVFLPIVGPALWFAVGRPVGHLHPLGPVGGVGPDDDEDFLRYIGTRAAEERWRHNAERHRRSRDADPTAEPPSAAA